MTSKDKTNAKERIEFLRQELNRHNYRYYVLNDPEITDFEYDVMMMELAALEKMYPELTSPDSPTVKVGSDIAGRPPGSREYCRTSTGGSGRPPARSSPTAAS